MSKKDNKLSFKGCNYFRQRIALSVLSGKPIEIKDIRADTDEPGLKEFEVNLLRLVDKLSNGMTLDMDETGTNLTFQPGILTGGVIDHTCCNGRAIGYYLELIFMLAPFFKNGIRATLRGITNSCKDPSVDSFKCAAVPLLKRFIVDSDDELQLNVRRRGAEPNGGGEIQFVCPKIKHLKPVQVLDYGKIKRIRGVVFSLRVSPSISNRIVEKAKGSFLKFIPDVFLSVDHATGERAGKSPGFGAALWAETTTGVVITSDATSKPGVKTAAEDLADEAAYSLLEEIRRGGCVDSNFQSLACLYVTLRNKDVSQFLMGPLSPYTVQFLRYLKEFFGAEFSLKVRPDANDSDRVKVLATCTGVGYSKLV